MSDLESLDLSSNELIGGIPTELTNLNFLFALNLSQNKLVGMIPQGKQFNTFLNDSYKGKWISIVKKLQQGTSKATTIIMDI